ncbi:hypothetical protein B296_00014585 [Ensete ventricosum]|uniref:Uncharacterized protein n=1 Tax=Ensete ventricosum TaxID=4639 RepID=A0A426ZRM5_ENSVE|nr:hypothetical protein B296_00014585 [Ensete ventricosum]
MQSPAASTISAAPSSITSAPSYHLPLLPANLRLQLSPLTPLVANTIDLNLKIVATISNQPIRLIGDPYIDNLVAAKSYYIYITNSRP